MSEAINSNNTETRQDVQTTQSLRDHCREFAVKLWQLVCPCSFTNTKSGRNALSMRNKKE